MYTQLSKFFIKSSFDMSLLYFDITNMNFQNRCCADFSRKKKDWTLHLLTDSTFGVQNPFQSIMLHGHGTGAALRGWPVYWVPQKFLTTPHRKCRHSLYLFLIFLFCYLRPSHLSLSHDGKFLRYRHAKNDTCHCHDFDFDDFIIKPVLCSTFLLMFFLHAGYLHRYTYDISRW